MKYIFVFLFSLVQCEKIFKNTTPLCKNCVHYKPPSHDNFDSLFGKCSYFRTKDLIDDKFSYDFADLSRLDEKKCGIDGKFFKEESNIDVKIFKHEFERNNPFWLPLFIYFLFTTFRSL